MFLFPDCSDPGLYHCGDNHCISYLKLCNGHSDCIDGSDEYDVNCVNKSKCHIISTYCLSVAIKKAEKKISIVNSVLVQIMKKYFMLTLDSIVDVTMDILGRFS